ncbi:unnamed protein product [Blepharisma stoltei]|uniref:Uncharacterized protein n=1 Tax=Blepharisma stoltei TaxID=1481888 RepID=A0AAU9JMS6_9CILI|nr:unnamed protein product [Blepharisma stoltei]
MELITKTSLKLKRKNNSIENTDEEIKQEKKRLSQMIASYFNKDQYMRRRGSERKRSMTQWPTNHPNQQQINSIKFPSFATSENKLQTFTVETLPTPKNLIKKGTMTGKLRKIRTEQDLSKQPIKSHPKRQIKLKTTAISGRKGIGINHHHYTKTCEININPVSP